MLITFLAATNLMVAYRIIEPENPDLKPIPDRLVVLTFDDSVKSQFKFAAPLLKRMGFGATFFITEGFTFTTDKEHYMTWEEIRSLQKMGFEIGNHTRNHTGVDSQSEGEFAAGLEAIENHCVEHGIPRPNSFAYPGNALSPAAISVLEKRGYRFARRGGAPEFPYEHGRGTAYDPQEDHPLLIPSAGDARPDWTLDDFILSVSMAKAGHIAVIQFHGVPDIEHPWVNTDQAKFKSYMKYLKGNRFTVIALRDLTRYVDPLKKPPDPFAVIQKRINERKRALN